VLTSFLTEKNTEKFGIKPKTRPYFAVLGEFDRTMGMYRQGRGIRIDVSLLAPEHLTFMYPDHFHLVWSKGLFVPKTPYRYSRFMICFSHTLNCRKRSGSIISTPRIEEAKRRDMWTGSYIEAHIWDPDIKLKVKGLDECERHRKRLHGN
jgi:hypothetical protein